MKWLKYSVILFLTFLFGIIVHATYINLSKPQVDLIRCHAAYGQEMTKSECYQYYRDKQKTIED